MNRILMCVSVALAALGFGVWRLFRRAEAALSGLPRLEAAAAGCRVDDVNAADDNVVSSHFFDHACTGHATAAPATTTSTTTTCPSVMLRGPDPDVTSGWPGSAFTAPGRSLQDLAAQALTAWRSSLDGRTPSHLVGWISGSPIHDGSGEPVDMEGSTYPEAFQRTPWRRAEMADFGLRDLGSTSTSSRVRYLPLAGTSEPG